MNQYEEIISHKQQKIVLKNRAMLLSRFRTQAEHRKINEEAFEDLKKLSPANLSPVLFYSIIHDWMVGYLIQKVGNGGYRILVKLDDWKILRVKKSAMIIKNRYPTEFEYTVSLQESLHRALVNLSKCNLSKKGKHVRR